jgi:RimJ/RimL family protein N-acetyltransferase
MMDRKGDSMTPPDSLQTARLVLRKPQPDDAPRIFKAYGQDADVTRYLMWRPHESVEDARAAVQRFLSGWSSGTRFCWIILSRDTNEVVGSIAARHDENGVNLGYLLAREFWGRGLMAEAVSAVTQWAFGDPTVFRVWAVCDVENQASARLLEKTGFVQEGILKKFSLHPNVSAIPRDCYCYAQTRQG